MPGFRVQDLGEDVLSTAEYYYTYTWTIAKAIGESASSSASPLIHLKEASTPTFTVNKENYVGSSLEYKYAKSVTWDDIKVSWYDTIGMLAIIKKWRASVWSQEEGLRTAREYKKETMLDCFLPTGLRRVGWVLYGSWPSQIRSGDLTYTNSDVKNIEVTITYDWANEVIE